MAVCSSGEGGSETLSLRRTSIPTDERVEPLIILVNCSVMNLERKAYRRNSRLAVRPRIMRSRQEVCKRTSGGGLPDGGDCRDFDAVGVAHAAEDIAAELRRIQLAEALLSDEQ
jgi:hypothetical protein